MQTEAAALLAALEARPLAELLASARELRETGHGPRISYSRKVFIPLTRLCRNTCGYCTFVRGPREVAHPYLLPEEVLEIARPCILVPDRHRRGTNLLGIAPARADMFRFGPGSMRGHAALARRLGYRVHIQACEILALDLDLPSDYAAWHRVGGVPA